MFSNRTLSLPATLVLKQNHNLHSTGTQIKYWRPDCNISGVAEAQKEEN